MSDVAAGFTPEQLDFLKKALKDEAPPITQQAAPARQEPPEPQPIKVTLGGQEITANSPEDLQRQVEAYEAQVNRNVEAIRLQDENRRRQQAQQGQPSFDRDSYARLFIEDPMKAYEYTKSFDPERVQVAAAFQAMAQKVQELEVRQSVQNFINTSDYTPSQENMAALESVMGKYRLPYTYEGLNLGYAYAKTAGMIGAPESATQVEHELEPEVRRPRALPRQRRSADAENVLESFSKLPADKMKEYLQQFEKIQ